MAAPYVQAVTLLVPAGTVEHDLLLVTIALTYAAAAPGAAPVIVPPDGWTAVLLDYPNGTWTIGPGDELRLGVYKRHATAVEPASYTFTWAAGPPCPVAAVIQGFHGALPGLRPSVNFAADAIAIAPAQGANPIEVTAPAGVPTVGNTQMLCVFAARNGRGP